MPVLMFSFEGYFLHHRYSLYIKVQISFLKALQATHLEIKITIKNGYVYIVVYMK